MDRNDLRKGKEAEAVLIAAEEQVLELDRLKSNMSSVGLFVASGNISIEVPKKEADNMLLELEALFNKAVTDAEAALEEV